MSTTSTTKPVQRHSSFYEAWVALLNVLQASNKLVPGFVIVAILLSSLIIVVCLISATLMVGCIVLLVVVTSVIVFANTRKYGEATLALVAGLLAAFTVDWDAARFIAFVGAWIGFSLLVLMSASIKLAADLERIYNHAAVSISAEGDSTLAVRKQLETIGIKGTPLQQLQAVERAEAVRLLVFRKVPLDLIADALTSVEIVAVVTQVDAKAATNFIADLTNILARAPGDLRSTMEYILDIMRESAAPPEDFIRAFRDSRSLVLSGEISPQAYFQLLRQCLEEGIAPEDVLDEIRRRIQKSA
jgi:hypothetical protein